MQTVYYGVFKRKYSGAYSVLFIHALSLHIVSNYKSVTTVMQMTYNGISMVCQTLTTTNKVYIQCFLPKHKCILEVLETCFNQLSFSRIECPPAYMYVLIGVLGTLKEMLFNMRLMGIPKITPQGISTLLSFCLSKNCNFIKLCGETILFYLFLDLRMANLLSILKKLLKTFQ